MDQATTPPRVGQPWPGQGGIYMGVMAGAKAADGTQQPDYHLIIAEAPAGEFRDLEWGGYGKDEVGAQSWTDGLANTLALRASKHDHPVAQAGADAEIAGHRDWYLPALGELKLCFANGRDHFAHDRWFWSSTQLGRYFAYFQGFASGLTSAYGKDWSRGVARLARRILQ